MACSFSTKLPAVPAAAPANAPPRANAPPAVNLAMLNASLAIPTIVFVIILRSLDSFDSNPTSFSCNLTTFLANLYFLDSSLNCLLNILSVFSNKCDSFSRNLSSSFFALICCFSVSRLLILPSSIWSSSSLSCCVSLVLARTLTFLAFNFSISSSLASNCAFIILLYCFSNSAVSLVCLSSHIYELFKASIF